MIKRMRRVRWKPVVPLVASIVLCAESCSNESPLAGEPAAIEDSAPPALSTGLYKPARSPATPLDAEQRAEIERLEALGYGTGSRLAGLATGVTVHEDLASPGLNLYVSAHAPEAVLMDMEGQRLHVWRIAASAIWNDAASRNRLGARYFRRAFVFENGDLMVIFEGVGLVRLDAASDVLWAFPAPGDAHVVDPHHDLEIGPGGRIFVLTRRARIIPWLDEKNPVLDDFVSVLDVNGLEIHRLSIGRAFGRSRFRSTLESRARRSGDLFHTNSIHLLDGSIAARGRAFARGNLLISMRNTSALAVIDTEEEVVVWVGQGAFRRQHDAKILPGGELLLFDNGPKSGEESSVLELDPTDLEVRWRYAGDDENPLHSATGGLAQRLPNGNTLVTESNNGRAVEVTRAGEIVWEFRSPHRAGRENRYVATLFDLVRLPLDFPIGWATEPPIGASPPRL